MMEGFGTLIAAIGWALLLGIIELPDSTMSSTGIVNILELNIASHVIYLGYFMILVGIVARGFNKFSGGDDRKGPQTPRRSDEGEIAALREGKMFD